MRKAILLLTVLFSYVIPSFCQDIYTYVASSTAGVPSYVDPNISAASNLTPIGTGFNTPCSMGFSGIDGFTGSAYTPSGPCVQVSLTASAGYMINATGFEANMRNSGTGPTKVRMAYSTDGGTTWVDDGTDHTPFSGSCATSLSGTNLASWTTFSIIGANLLFRLYPFAAPGSTGTFQIFELHIMGTVNCGTPPAITVTPSSGSMCRGSAGVTFTASGAGPGGTYTWAAATGLSATTGAAVTAAPAATTTYTVTGTTVLGCAGTATATVTVNPLPAATITASGPTNFCPGDSVTLTTGSTSGYTYQWYNGITAISGATDTSYIAHSAGSYKISVTNTFGCTSVSAPTAVSVITPPTAIITPLSSPTFCAGNSVVLDASIGAGYVYQWNNNGTPIAGATNASYTATTTGYISVTITAPTGCTSTSASMLITSVPLPFIDTSGKTKFCVGNSVYLTANVGGAVTGVTYQWNRNSSILPGATNQVYTATASGIYDCTVNIAAGSCITTTSHIAVTVYPLPFPVVTFDGAVLSTPNTFTSYQWFINTVAIPGATNSTFRPSTNASYRIRVYNGNGCSNYSAAIPIYNLAVNQLNKPEVKVFPNPVNSVLHIESTERVRVVICGIEGKVFIDQKNAADIDMSALANGMYILMLYSDNGERIQIQKIVKE